MDTLIKSNNGKVHLAEYVTKVRGLKKTPTVYPGHVRKLCDGQWVSEKKQVNEELTCSSCKKIKEKNNE